MSSEHFPAQLNLLSDENVNELRVRCSMYDRPYEYVESLVGKYHDHMLYVRTFKLMGELIDHAKTASGQKNLLELKKAFLAGNLLGAEVVEATGGGELVDRSALQDIEINVADDLDREEQLALAGFALQVQGMEHFDAATNFHTLIGRWGHKIANRHHQVALRAGFGMVLGIGTAAIQEYEHQALEYAVLQANTDWDKELGQLTVD
ncbi:MAG: hypothetical protein ABIR37_00385 [Candidatus Saccharimonadales bacterium]